MSLINDSKRSYSFATSRLTKSIVLPVSSFHAAMRTSGWAMGVSESHPSSVSMSRRLRLSTMVTAWPLSDRWTAVGQPQKPSPPRTRIFLAPPAIMLTGAAARRAGRARSAPGALRASPKASVKRTRIILHEGTRSCARCSVGPALQLRFFITLLIEIAALSVHEGKSTQLCRRAGGAVCLRVCRRLIRGVATFHQSRLTRGSQ